VRSGWRGAMETYPPGVRFQHLGSLKAHDQRVGTFQKRV
jgi:hypothetical protein